MFAAFVLFTFSLSVKLSVFLLGDWVISDAKVG
jgi:hypothetical protein